MTTELTNPDQLKVYKSYLAELMNYNENTTTYTKETTFTQERLLQLTDEDIYEWLANKAYGTPRPSSNDNPILCRSNTLEYAKKAVSYFMPNKNTQWCVSLGTGNPTKCTKVNTLIKAVKKKEVRKEGRPSEARRPLEIEEMRRLLNILHGSEDDTIRSVIAAMVKFQFHLVGRLDDTSRFQMADLKIHSQFPFALQGRMCWSKNVREERDAMEQIILASKDETFCVHVSLANHLETFLSSGLGDTSRFVFSISDGLNGPARTKDKAYSILKSIFSSDEFSQSSLGKLGTHSIRKLPSTYARQNGCGRDDIDCRGRWKKGKRQVDTYIDIELPYPDAKVASVLSIGGPIKYVLRENSNVSDAFILEYVSPLIRRKLGPAVALTLGKALFWGAMDDEARKLLESTLVERIRDAYERIRTLDIGTNPIKKVNLVISGFEGTLYIDEIREADEDQAPVAQQEQQNNEEGITQRMNPARQQVHDQNQLLGVYSQISSLNRQCTEIKNELETLRSTQNDNMSRMHSSIRRIHMFPLARNRENNADGGSSDRSSGAPQVMPTLMKCPKTLNVLWQEYEFGINGQKAAKHYTSRERGNSRYTYHRRKVFWDKVSELLRAGYDSHTAIDKIYEAYNNQSVTQIINSMRRDKVNGGHPLLRV